MCSTYHSLTRKEPRGETGQYNNREVANKLPHSARVQHSYNILTTLRHEAARIPEQVISPRQSGEEVVSNIEMIGVVGHLV